jgi:hypothetical protein
VSIRRAASSATSASVSKPGSTITRPPEIRVGKAWRLMPAVWKWGRKETVLSAAPIPAAEVMLT